MIKFSLVSSVLLLINITITITITLKSQSSITITITITYYPMPGSYPVAHQHLLINQTDIVPVSKTSGREIILIV